MNIVLIGMPGVGKSTIGVILAKELGMDFVDADLVIQKQEKRRLSVIMKEEGIDGFLAIEEGVCRDLSRLSDTVIATGGSAVYGKEAMECLKRTGRMVYLKASYGVLEKRLRDLKGRGVVLKEGQTLAELYRERTALYERYADLTLSEDGLGLEETLEALLEALGDR